MNTERDALFSVESFQGSNRVWKRMQVPFAHVHQQSFWDRVTSPGDRRFVLDHLKSQFSSIDTTIFLLRRVGKIVGYASFFPCTGTNRFFSDEIKHFGLTRGEYYEMQEETMEVGWTAILPQYRSLGGWSLLMESLEERGSLDHQFMLRYVRTANNYANKVIARYENDIIFSSELYSQRMGPQIYLRATFPRSRE